MDYRYARNVADNFKRGIIISRVVVLREQISLWGAVGCWGRGEEERGVGWV